MFPAKKVAIALWVVAAVVFVLQQYSFPMLMRGMFDNSGELMVALDRIANAVLYPGVMAALGAIVYLLGEIRDATPPRQKDLNP